MKGTCRIAPPLGP